MKKILVIVFSLFLFQNAFAYTCPNYMFSTNLSKGMTSADVRVMQEILNLDSRTLVAQIGPGSRGAETRFFGVATREALKRFQALFIEYIGVADGKFNSKTRTTMNAVCKGPFFTGGSGSVYDMGSSTKDILPPIVAIAGPNSSDINETFRAFIGANEAIQTPSLEGLIVSNATTQDLRKVSSTTFSFLVIPNQDARSAITLQFEAESISDLVGNKNEKATNEWVVALTGTSSLSNATDTLPFEFPNIDLPIVTPTTDCSTVSSVDVSDYNNPCYGKAPMSYASTNSGAGDSGGGGGGGGGEQIMQMLSGLMQGLAKALGGGGGGQDAGGTGTPSAPCMCPPLMGQPTVVLAGLKGPSGGSLATPCPGAGKYVGKTMPPPPICGLRIDPKTGQCIGPNLNGAGIPMTSTVGACGPTWHWNN